MNATTAAPTFGDIIEYHGISWKIVDVRDVSKHGEMYRDLCAFMPVHADGSRIKYTEEIKIGRAYRAAGSITARRVTAQPVTGEGWSHTETVPAIDDLTDAQRDILRAGPFQEIAESLSMLTTEEIRTLAISEAAAAGRAVAYEVHKRLQGITRGATREHLDRDTIEAMRMAVLEALSGELGDWIK